jgi:hypothetical protein
MLDEKKKKRARPGLAPSDCSFPMAMAMIPHKIKNKKEEKTNNVTTVKEQKHDQYCCHVFP